VYWSDRSGSRPVRSERRRANETTYAPGAAMERKVPVVIGSGDELIASLKTFVVSASVPWRRIRAAPTGVAAAAPRDPRDPMP